MKKSKLVLFLIIFFIPKIYSQELNEDFIKTLPPGIQNDVLDRAKKQGAIDKPVYRSIETQTKLEKKNLKI